MRDNSMVPRTCTICRHADREAIERLLVERVPYRAIASQHGVSKPALQRHAENHLASAIAEAHAAEDTTRGEHLLARLHELLDEAAGVLARAERGGGDRLGFGGDPAARG